MNASTRRSLLAFVVVSWAASAIAAAPPRAPKAPDKPAPAAPSAPPTDVLAGLAFRSIGPAIMGGRIDDFAVVREPALHLLRRPRPRAASGRPEQRHHPGARLRRPGGLVHRRRRGRAVRSLDRLGRHRRGRTTGRARPGATASTSRSTAGKTWIHLGLADTHHIGRVVVHPTNPDVVYVAALGHLWGPNRSAASSRRPTAARPGSTRSSSSTRTPAFIDVAMDPENPRRSTRRRISGGARRSASTAAVPAAASARRPTAARRGRSSRAACRRGRRRPHRPRRLSPRPAHRLRARRARQRRAASTAATTRAPPGRRCPTRTRGRVLQPGPHRSRATTSASGSWARRIFTLGGRRQDLPQDVGQQIHGDDHALWIDPADTNHLMAGNDGGVHVTLRPRPDLGLPSTTCRSASSTRSPYDMQKPYRVCGGLQDNGSWCGPSRTPLPAAASRTTTGPAWAAATASTT